MEANWVAWAEKSGWSTATLEKKLVRMLGVIRSLLNFAFGRVCGRAPFRMYLDLSSFLTRPSSGER